MHVHVYSVLSVLDHIAIGQYSDSYSYTRVYVRVQHIYMCVVFMCVIYAHKFTAMQTN